jgi:hypothetical protein
LESKTAEDPFRPGSQKPLRQDWRIDTSEPRFPKLSKSLRPHAMDR